MVFLWVSADAGWWETHTQSLRLRPNMERGKTKLTEFGNVKVRYNSKETVTEPGDRGEDDGFRYNPQESADTEKHSAGASLGAETKSPSVPQKSGQICPAFRRTQGLHVPLNQFTCVNILEGKQIYVSRSWRFLAVMKGLQMLLSWPENAKARLSMRVSDDDSTELVSFWWIFDEHLIKTSRFRAKAAGADLMAAACSFKEPLEERLMTRTSLLQQMKSRPWHHCGSSTQTLMASVEADRCCYASHWKMWSFLPLWELRSAADWTHWPAGACGVEGTPQ